MATIVLRRPFILIAAILVPAMVFSAVICFKEFNFNAPNALDRWQSMILNGKVEYRLVEDADNGYVEAVSSSACSALYYRVGYKLKDCPTMSWKWSVVKFPDKTNIEDAAKGDDYAARVYVIFPFLSFSSSKFVEYVWDEARPVGTISNSPKGRNIKQIVVRSGPAGDSDGGWVTETRNVYDDYRAAFGEEPRRGAGAIAIMCNADNTKSKAESRFDDITIGIER